jgi:hypothetical protein
MILLLILMKNIIFILIAVIELYPQLAPEDTEARFYNKMLLMSNLSMNYT